MLRTAIIGVLVLLLRVVGYGQDPLVEALRHYQAGELAQARVQVDLAVATPEHLADPEAWLLRGFVYKDLFKAAAQPDSAETVRDQALNSLYTCLTLDKDST